MALMRLNKLLNHSGLRIVSLAKKTLAAAVIVAVVFFIGRIYESERGPALQRWHTWSGDEMTAGEIDRASFASYLKLIHNALILTGIAPLYYCHPENRVVR